MKVLAVVDKAAGVSEVLLHRSTVHHNSHSNSQVNIAKNTFMYFTVQVKKLEIHCNIFRTWKRILLDYCQNQSVLVNKNLGYALILKLNV